MTKAFSTVLAIKLYIGRVGQILVCCDFIEMVEGHGALRAIIRNFVMSRPDVMSQSSLTFVSVPTLVTIIIKIRPIHSFSPHVAMRVFNKVSISDVMCAAIDCPETSLSICPWHFLKFVLVQGEVVSSQIITSRYIL